MKHPINNKQLHLFAAPQEKGSIEWGAFNVVRADTMGAYRVAVPHIAHEPRYSNAVRIKRYPRRLTLTIAH